MVKFDSIIDINDEIIPFITDGKVENFKSQLLQNGDVILADTAEDKTTGKAVEITGISEKYYAVSGLHTMIGRPNIQFAPKFLGYYLNCLSYRKQLLKLMQGIKVFSLSKSSVAKTEISFPKEVTEQQQIGAFFDTLNRTITLHQRKLEKLKLLKLGLIQNLFPANGKLRPTINMTNNVEKWQQLKLFDVLEIPIKERLENPALNKLITVGLNLTGIRVGSARETLEIGATTYYVRRKGQLIYGKQNFFNGSMAIIDDKYDGYATSVDVPALNINNNKVDSKFLYYYISRPCYYKRSEAQAIGTGSKRIHEKTLLSFEIYLPPLATQKKIAKLINNIEKYINKQNVLLNNYINIKNKYLQLLFI